MRETMILEMERKITAIQKRERRLAEDRKKLDKRSRDLQFEKQDYEWVINVLAVDYSGNWELHKKNYLKNMETVRHRLSQAAKGGDRSHRPGLKRQLDLMKTVLKIMEGIYEHA